MLIVGQKVVLLLYEFIDRSIRLWSSKKITKTLETQTRSILKTAVIINIIVVTVRLSPKLGQTKQYIFLCEHVGFPVSLDCQDDGTPRNAIDLLRDSSE